MGPFDTSPEAERFLIEGCRRMSPGDALARVGVPGRIAEVLVLRRYMTRFLSTATP